MQTFQSDGILAGLFFVEIVRICEKCREKAIEQGERYCLGPGLCARHGKRKPPTIGPDSTKRFLWKYVAVFILI